MCGIAGLICRDPERPVQEGELRAMCGAMALRGPDDEHVHIGPGAGLGARRLAVIDLVSGRQPLRNEDGTIWVTFNGEIYNHAELRENLVRRGHRFSTRSDTEVLVHLYEEEGDAMVERLRGMFAFGLWDERRRRLLLARDRMGKKPLFYWAHAGGIAFASSLCALLRLKDLPRDLDWRAVDAFFSLKYVPAPLSILKAVRKLPAAHRLVWEEGRLRQERYWNLRFEPKTRLSEEEARMELLRLLRAAVKRRLVADVPVGAMLSGGLDSSAVVALMSEAGPVRTFSVGFEDRSIDERPYARELAGRFGTEHAEAQVRLEDLSALPRLAVEYGEPFADSSAIPTYHLARLARGSVTVALNGDGGDEAFSGYSWHDLAANWAWADRLPLGPRRGLARACESWAAHPNPLLRKTARGLAYLSWSAGRRYADARSCLHSHLRTAFYRPDFLAALDGHDPQNNLAAFFAEFAGKRQALDEILHADYSSFLPDQLCVKMDVSTMANSLEARSPFLDQELVEFAATLPPRWKRRRGRGKLILRSALEGILPPSILARKKQGFVVPLRNWMSGPETAQRLEGALSAPRSPLADVLKPEAVRNALQEHRRGKRDWSGFLWACLVFDVWREETLAR